MHACVLQPICNSLLKLSWLQRINICYRIVGSTANLGFAAEIVFVCSEFVIRCRKWVVCSELTFAAEWCVLQWSWDSLLKCVFCSEFVIRCRNWVVCSEFMIRCWSWVVCNECVIRCRIVCFAANLWFAAEVELSAVTLWFTANTKLSATN
jgi:hypothetical protein